MQLCSHHNPRTVQRGNTTSVVGPLRKLEVFSDVILPKDEKP